MCPQPPLPEPALVPAEIISVTGLTNREFLDTHARPGRVGLSAGVTLVDRAIQRAQRHLNEERVHGKWTHAFLFQGRRLDGQNWVVESDLQVMRKHISLGAQENRIHKYDDVRAYTWLAVLDFQLAPEQTSALLTHALDLVAHRTRYSLRELLGTLYALRHPEWRNQENRLARDHSMYCSALVQHLFKNIGVDLMPGVHEKNITPEDISHSPVPHTMWVLDRSPARGRLKTVAVRLRRRLNVRVKAIGKSSAARGAGGIQSNP